MRIGIAMYDLTKTAFRLYQRMTEEPNRFDTLRVLRDKMDIDEEDTTKVYLSLSRTIEIPGLIAMLIVNTVMFVYICFTSLIADTVLLATVMQWTTCID